MSEQPALSLDTPAIAGQGAVRPDDAGAGDDDADRVAAIGMADRPYCAGAPHALRRLGVGDGFAARNLPQGSPDRTLELSPSGGDGQGVDSRKVTGKIGG